MLTTRGPEGPRKEEQERSVGTRRDQGGTRGGGQGDTRGDQVGRGEIRGEQGRKSRAGALANAVARGPHAKVKQSERRRSGGNKQETPKQEVIRGRNQRGRSGDRGEKEKDEEERRRHSRWDEAGLSDAKSSETCSLLPMDLLYGQFETQRAALEQMAVRLSSLQYPSPTSRRSSAQTKANSLQQLEAEYQELSDWLMDMDAMVTDSHQLMMSEEQRIHLFKSSHAELQMMESRRSSLLSRLDLFRRNGPEPPRDLVHKVHSLNHTWDQIKNLLCLDSSGRCPSLLSAAPLVTAGHYTLSPLTTSLLQQLEARIKELKSWLRDTELLIFNSCLCNHKEPEQQLASFKSLCADIRARRRAVASVLKLCQKLLQQNQVSPTLELGPEAQQHQEALLLLSINLERRWEAIVMQALQWQNRLRREMGEEQVPGNFLEPGLVDLHQITSVQNTATPGMLTDDSWEWDETDMTLSDSNEDTPEPVQDPNQEPNHNQRNSKVYQVYSLHHVEREPLFPLQNGKNKKHKFLAKSLSKDSSFSSVESLPDVLGGILKHKQDSWNKKSKSEFECRISVSSRRSGSESGIDTGDTETITSEIQDYEEGKREDRCKLEGFGNHKEDLGSLCRDSERMEDFASSYMKKKRSRKSGEAVEMLINGRGILTPADSDSDLDFESMKQLQENRSSPVLSHGSSLESLLALGVELFPSQHGAYRSIDDSNEETAEREESESVKSEELSRRTLELLKRLENIQSPLGGSLTRSVSDMALVSMSPNRIPASPSLGGKISPLSGIAFHLSPPSLIHEGSATASLTELSSAEEVSQASADFKSRFLDPANAANTANANFYCRKQVNRLEEMDGASLSMVVNVSSACTDDEDDNSDLLSASTLTEEELGVRDEDEERFSVASSANEDDLDSPFGLDVMQKELQHWIRTPFSRSEKGLTDELQCGANVRSESAETTTTCSQLPISKRHRSAQENRRSATRSYISRYADDVENGNVEQSWERRRDADEELLREEASVFTKIPARDLFVCTHTEEPPHDVSEDADKTPLVEQLQGELPCHSSLTQTQRVPQGTSPLQKTNARKAITIQERFKFMSLVTEQARREVREGGAKRRHGSHCCGHRPGSSSFSEETRPNEENVHDFVMEIMDLTNARKNRAQTQTQMQTQAGTQGATIRDKVLDHTHRSVQLRRGDFYSYLSLSSHDSDCGEVLQLNNTSPTPELTASPHSPTSPSPDPFPSTDPCPSPDLCPSLEQFDKPADMVHPLSPDIRDEEKLFPACTEEVYLGPPLCYSLSAPRGQRGVLQTKTTPSLKCDPGNVRSVGLSYYSVLQREDTGGCQSSRLFSEGGVRAMTP
uniref:Uncharacterized protein n=1 Tax=Knipowitschia caucasica TaxID=637954 RepID=A0AAV2JCL7_KNICA